MKACFEQHTTRFQENHSADIKVETGDTHIA